jgi:hypothetical protein
LAEVDAATRLRGITEALGRGAHILLALSEPQDELRDYERLCTTAEAFIYAAMSRLMARRLARA